MSDEEDTQALEEFEKELDSLLDNPGESEPEEAQPTHTDSQPSIVPLADSGKSPAEEKAEYEEQVKQQQIDSYFAQPEVQQQIQEQEVASQRQQAALTAAEIGRFFIP